MGREAPDRWILHVDLDQFLAAVEVLRHPELRGRPVVVGGTGDPTRRRMVVSTASYEARAFGVHSGMPLRQAARRCPEAVFLPLDPPTYLAASERVMATLRSQPVTVEVLGWDEAFLAAETADPECLAVRIQNAVLSATGLHCSIGIGRNKLQAKLATGLAKPAPGSDGSTTGFAKPARGSAGLAGIYRLTDESWMAVMGDRPTSALWGIGERTARKLRGLGIETVAQLAAADWQALAQAFGPTIGPSLRLTGMGVGPADVHPEPYVPRSRSRETTFAVDQRDRTAIEAKIATLARELSAEAAEAGRQVVRVGLKVRLAPYFTRTSTAKLAAPTVDVEPITQAALGLLDGFDLTRPVRLLGVRVEYEPPAST
jgi:DNA polymerase IV